MDNSASRLNLLLAWLEDHFASDQQVVAVADRYPHHFYRRVTLPTR